MSADFRTLVESAPDIIAIFDRNRRYVYINDAIEAATGVPAKQLIGKVNDDLMQPADAAVWRDALEDVFAHGVTREIECPLDTPRGRRVFASVISPLPDGRACAMTRDVTDVRAVALLQTAVNTMMTGLVIVEAPSGKLLFSNVESARLLGALPSIDSATDYDAVAGSVSRALGGDTVVAEVIDIARPDGTRLTLSLSAAPVRDATGSVVAAVATFNDITEAKRTSDGARYLAAAAKLLEDFEPSRSLKAVVELAIPRFADWCFVHLRTDEGLELAVVTHDDPVAVERIRAYAGRVGPDTALARVLAGGGPELVRVVDADVLERATTSSEHRQRMEAAGFRSAVVAPLTGRTGALGAITFAMARSGRTYDADDLAMLAELARRTGIALENATLFAAEHDARRAAEAAHARTRCLQELTTALSNTTEKNQVVSVFVASGRAAIGASASYAWMLRDTDTLELAAIETAPVRPQFSRFRMSDRMPICDVIRSGQLMVFSSREAMAVAYPDAARMSDPRYNAWAVVPFVVDGRAIGATSFSFADERAFSDADRELLTAMAGQASLALERSRLIESERRARARERQLHVLAARFASALTQQEIGRIVSEEVVSAFTARTAAAAIRTDDGARLLHVHGLPAHQQITEFSLDSVLPMAEALRTGQLVSCTPEDAVTRYPEIAAALAANRMNVLVAVPFAFEGRIAGGLSVSFAEQRDLSDDDRELLGAMGQLTAQALERARLSEAHQRSELQLRTALAAGRAATWTVDITTMKSHRDPSYAQLLGLEENNVAADFMSVHPDDREIARAAFQRTMAENVPYAPIVRLQRGDGTYMWAQAFGQLMRDIRGRQVLSGVVVDIDEAKRASMRAEDERRLNETLQRLATSLATELDHDRLVRRILDETSILIGAESASFSPDDATPLEPATASMLEVRIVSRAGDTYGRLTFRHSSPYYFTDEHHRIVHMISNHASVALENARLYRTVREHKDALQLAVERAQDADRRKDEFLAMLGHELRNPLAPITTALELIELKGVDAVRKERDVIRRQVTHLSRLIDDLLDVSRITRGKVQLAKQVIELATVVQKAIEMSSPQLDRRHQNLVVDVPREGLLVDGDPTRLAQVLQNLVTNASKYSDDGSTIEVRATVGDGRVEIVVRDNGIGIAPELLPRLFQMFVQGERTLDRAQGGLGIGLTIARSLLELHGGTISAASDGVGKGSTFTVTLPPSTRLRTSTEAIEPLNVARVGSAARVLLVDDNIDAVAMLRETLAAMGHQLEVAHDGPSALEIAARFKPDIAVLDIGLPVMSGYELAQKLREQLGEDKLRLIAVTGYGQDTDRARSREVGFDHHLIKPIALDALLALLAK